MEDHKQRPRHRGSVFAKLVAIMFALAVCLLLMVTGFFWLIVSPNFSFSLDRLTREYAAAIAAAGPDRQAATQIRNRLDVLIGYEGPGGNWATDNDLPSITNVRAGAVHRSPHGRDYYLVPAPNGGDLSLRLEFDPADTRGTCQTSGFIAVSHAGSAAVCSRRVEASLAPSSLVGRGS